MTALSGIENGLVAVNPARHEHVVDLGSVASDGAYRALVGSADQSPGVNDGAPVGDEVALSALDGRFLARLA